MSLIITKGSHTYQILTRTTAPCYKFSGLRKGPQRGTRKLTDNGIFHHLECGDGSMEVYGQQSLWNNVPLVVQFIVHQWYINNFKVVWRLGHASKSQANKHSWNRHMSQGSFHNTCELFILHSSSGWGKGEEGALFSTGIGWPVLSTPSPQPHTPMTKVPAEKISIPFKVQVNLLRLWIEIWVFSEWKAFLGNSLRSFS